MDSVLLYNPVAGRDRERRRRVVEQVSTVLRQRGFSLHVEPTYARGSGQAQSREAVERGAKAVFARGGDGTVHDVLQGIACSQSLLGILPLGSANALAQELRLPADPVKAAASFLPDRFATLQTTVVNRPDQQPLYSLCMAGAGPAGLLMYRMLAVDRSRFGRWRYYEHALRLFLKHRFEPFTVEITTEDGSLSQHSTVSVMALRVGDLQGVFSGIARGASAFAGTLHVVLVAPPARLHLPLWLLSTWLGIRRLHPGVAIVKALAVHSRDTVPLQVDGEWAGRSPVTILAQGPPPQRVLVPASAARASSLPRSVA